MQADTATEYYRCSGFYAVVRAGTKMSDKERCVSGSFFSIDSGARFAALL